MKNIYLKIIYYTHTLQSTINVCPPLLLQPSLPSPTNNFKNDTTITNTTKCPINRPITNNQPKQKITSTISAKKGPHPALIIVSI